jgi:hypothetical protein
MPQWNWRKRLSKIHEQVNPQPLILVLEDHGGRPWSRIAAAYVLGFLEYGSNTAGVTALLGVLKNSKNQFRLGHMRRKL